MSSVISPPSPVKDRVSVSAPRRRNHRLRIGLIALCSCAVIAAVGWYGTRFYNALTVGKKVDVPTVKVQRGNVSLSVTARGDLRGGNPESLAAPMTGGSDVHLNYLRKTGEQVRAGDVVVQFDTTEQEYKLKEAQADLAEAEQHILQASAQLQAEEEEDRYQLLKAKTDVKSAELEVLKNPILPAIQAEQNNLAVKSAHDHLTELEQNLSNRKATNQAGITMQQAGKGKAEAQALVARQNIEAMTLKAHRDGYVAVKQNTNVNFAYSGMTLAYFQVGDLVRPGMVVAEIPDLKNWEIGANIGELDRGHLTVGQSVDVNIIAIPYSKFTGHVKDLGGTSGPPWDRHFECKISLDNPSSDLRPGMSARIVIHTDELRDVLSLPAQALFEADGRTFVYVQSGRTFASRDVKLVRRNESRVVVDGLKEGQVVALANPIEIAKKKTSTHSALESLPK